MLFLPEDRDRGLFQEELCWAIEEGRASNERWHLRRDGSRFWASGSMMPLLDDAGRVRGFLNVFRDNTALRTDSEHCALVMAEMSHRMKNTFATIQAVALQTLRRGGVSKEIQDTFEARLIALARSHELLTRNQWHGAALTEVLERTLLPYGDGERANMKGPRVWLPAQAVELLGLAFHELGTNAAKYGALSVPDGFIDICWHIKTAANGTHLAQIVWRERGGPLVTVPEQRGFGSRLLEQGVVQHLDGTLKLAFHPQGLECSICLPITLDHQVAAFGKDRSHLMSAPDPLT
jgi:two-component sensor histidine kinase